MLVYPPLDHPFDLNPDSNQDQIEAFLCQLGKVLGRLSRKLNNTQKKYSTTEIELLSIAENLKYVENIVLVITIKEFFNRKSLTYPDMKCASYFILRRV